VTFLQLDVSDLESVSAAPSEFAKAADHLDVLVNNAGILLDGDSAVLAIDDEVIRKTLETNTLGPLRVTRSFAALLIKSSAPRVINVSIV
jgi:NAD(P)-dependent dehydrogenase (short-subunit alcohol dehydrogenase family)